MMVSVSLFEHQRHTKRSGAVGLRIWGHKSGGGKAMLLEGSCHCGSVRFRVESKEPYPYQACYCSICRKTAGGGGFAINLGADANTLDVEGAQTLSVYNAKLYDREDPNGEVSLGAIMRGAGVG
jgi:hypothetical protein